MKRSDFRVFLGNAPWRQKGRLGVRAGSRWPFSMPVSHGEKVPSYVPFPFFLGYATSVLEKAGFSALLMDAIAMGVDEDTFIQTAKDYSPHLVVLETSTPTFSVDMKIAKDFRNHLPNRQGSGSWVCSRQYQTVRMHLRRRRSRYPLYIQIS